jgi:HlyD family secretion protein
LKKTVIIIVVLVVAALAVIGVMRSRRPQIPDVRTAQVERAGVVKAVVATGEIRPYAVAEVKSRIGGVVRRFFVEEGDSVTRGRQLAEIVPTATPAELVYAREHVKTSRLQMEQSQRKLKRLEELARQELVPPEDLEDAETRLALDAARYDAALAELSVLEQGSARALTPTEEPVTDETAEALTDMTITSPIDGIVLSKNVDEGSAVIPISSAYGGTSLMTLADVSSMHFEGDLDESDVAKIRLNMPAKVYVDAYPDTVFAGLLTRIAPQGIKDEGVVNFNVEAEITDDAGLLRTGMSADVQLVLDERTDVLTLPEGAIAYSGDSTFVDLLDPDAPEGKIRRAVEVGLSDGIRTEITGGLEEGDRVVLQ